MNDHRQRALINRSSWRLAGAAAISVVALSSSGWAQETVIIGGSGQSAIEVNLDALLNLDGRASGRTLRFPGEDLDAILGPPVLRVGYRCQRTRPGNQERIRTAVTFWLNHQWTAVCIVVSVGIACSPLT